MIRRNKKPGQANLAAGYVRRSTDRQEQSIPDQKKALQAYTTEHQLRLVRFYIDDAISGASTVGRRAFQQMICSVQSNNGRQGKNQKIFPRSRFEVCYPSQKPAAG